MHKSTDIEKPVITGMPSNITQNTDDSLPTAVITWNQPTATDNSASQTLTSTHSPGSSFAIGVTYVDYMCVDSSGNKVVESFTVTVEGNHFNISLMAHPIREVEQCNYYVIVVTLRAFWSTASCLCYLFRRNYQSILFIETYHVILGKITWPLLVLLP